jgi:LuxR family maltose regulon positive regulatory protein
MEFMKAAAVLQARIYRLDGDLPAAVAALEEVQQIMRSYELPTVLAELNAWLACYQAELGQPEAAARWAESVPLELDQNPGYTRGIEAFCLARVRLALGQTGPALDLLTGLENAARSGGSLARQVEALVLRAVAHTRLQQPQAAAERLEQALRLSAPAGLQRTFLDEGEGLRPILDLLERSNRLPGPAQAHLQRLLSGFPAGSMPEPAAPQRQAQPKQTLLAEPLSERELEVLRLMAQGLTNPGISAELIVALSTVKTHLNNIYGKLSVRNRAEAVLRAKEIGLL